VISNQGVVNAGGIVNISGSVVGHRSGPEPKERPKVHLVVTEAGLFGTYFDEDRAHARARDVAGVVVSLPVTADYRSRESQ
jgi:hypothetical protein